VRQGLKRPEFDDDLAERLQEFVYRTVTAVVAIGALDGKQLGSAGSATNTRSVPTPF
jgi:hypothetical protein